MRLFSCVVLVWTLIGRLDCSQLSRSAVYHGCFSAPYLPRHNVHLLNPFVAEDCFKLCSGTGYNRAGLDGMHFICYCGDEVEGKMSKAEDTLCKPCKDDNSLFCGGVLKLSLYAIEANVTSDNLSNVEDSGIGFEEEPMMLLAGHGGIYMYNATSQALRLVIKEEGHFDALDYNLRSKEGFVIWDENIYSFPLFAEPPLDMHTGVTLVGYLDRCLTFTVDWVHRKMYYPDCYAHRIRIVDISDRLGPYHEDTIIRLSDEGAWAMGMAVDPYRGLLFWTTGAALWSCRLDGRVLRKIVPEFPVNRVSSLALDLATSRVYFTGMDKQDRNHSRLYFASYNGSMSHSMQYDVYETGYHILSFGIFGHHLYTVKGVEGNSSVVMASKLEYNHRPTAFVHGDNIKAYLLRLVHPELQSPPEVDACTYYGCSNLCVIVDTIPRCFCPQYHEILEPDYKTCELYPNKPKKDTLVYTVALGVMLILLLVLGAGVLMCLADKVWSQLYPSVVALSVPGSARSTFTAGRTVPDGERLV